MYRAIDFLLVGVLIWTALALESSLAGPFAVYVLGVAVPLASGGLVFIRSTFPEIARDIPALL